MKFVSMFVAVLFAAGCGVDAADRFRSASPSRQGININVPQGQGLTAQGQLQGVRLSNPDTAQREVLGQTAVFYTFTVDVSTFVNGAVWVILNMVEDIVKDPPTTVSQNQAVWGPATPPLSPITYKFTVTDNANTYNYVLQGKPKTADDSAYVSLLTGQHTPSGSNTGQGGFILDLNASHTLNNDPNQAGTVTIQYQRDTSLNLAVSAAFNGVVDNSSGTQQLVNAGYEFTQANGGDGSFQFALTKDFDGKGQLETLKVESRWQNNGTGRSDILGSGGDLGTTQLQVSECWDSNFKETYYQDNLNINPVQGAASACAFSSAQYSNL